MKLKLMNYLNKFTKEVDINEGDYVSIDIISGDWVIKEPIWEDASDDRLLDFYDGNISFIATKENIDKINSLKRNYDLLDLKYEGGIN